MRTDGTSGPEDGLWDIVGDWVKQGVMCMCLNDGEVNFAKFYSVCILQLLCTRRKIPGSGGWKKRTLLQ